MTSQDTLTLLACQIEIPATQTALARDEHLIKTANKLRQQLRGQNVDLVVLPELSSIDYSRMAFDHLDELSENLDGVSFQTWRSIAIEFGVFVCYGFARRDPTGTYVSAGVVAPDGQLLGHYDKLHLCHYGASMEKDYFTAGDHLFTFKIGEFTISPIICYDIRIPELSRTLTLKHGVDLILHSGAYYRDESFETWHNFTMTRAMENQVFLLSLNRAGENWGNSIFCKPWMDENIRPINFAKRQEDFQSLTFTKQELHRARQDYTFLQDRLGDYSAL